MKSKITMIVAFFVLLSSMAYASGEKEILSMTLASSNQKSSVSAAGITVNITNNSEQVVKVLKRNTPLEDMLSDDIFSVSIDNEKVKYIGITAKREVPIEADYVVFAPKETKTVNIDMANYYKMESSGTYTISYKGTIPFALKDRNNAFKDTGVFELKELTPTVKSLTLEFTGSAQKSNEEISIPNFQNCSSSQMAEIKSAHSKAVDLADIASTDMNNANKMTSDPRYATWFGSANRTRQETVRKNFEEISNALDTKEIQYICGGNSCQSSTFAYVHSAQPYTIHLCDKFWDAPIEGTNSKAGTIIHQVSHFPAVADSKKYAGILGDIEPTTAIRNATSYEYFAENTRELRMNGIKERASGRYAIRGIVKSATTGSGIASAKLSLYNNGHYKGSIRSNSEGNYVFRNIAPGTYDIKISASRYITDTVNVIVNRNSVDKYINLLNITTSTNYRVVLTWAKNPRDLDSHLHIANPNGEGCMDDVYYLDKHVAPYADLDVDDRYSYGPETVTISKFVTNKNHEYWVEHYAGTPDNSVPNAVVKVYSGCRLVKTYRSPNRVTKQKWHVFNIGKGGIQSVNKFYDDTSTLKCGHSLIIPRQPGHIRASDGNYDRFVYINNYAMFGATKYEIFRAESFTSTPVYLGATRNKSFKDYTAKKNKVYYYAVQACNYNGCSTLSPYNRGFKKRPFIPTEPRTHKASYNLYRGYVYLYNYATYGATKYKLYRTDSYNGTLKYLGATRTKKFKDITAKPNKSYYYAIRACNSNGCSALSSYVKGMKRKPLVPKTPKTQKASFGTYNNFVYLNGYGVYGATTYRIYRTDSYNGTLKYLGATRSKTFKDITARSRKSYYYAIRACNSSGCSALSSYVKGQRKN